MHHNAVITYNYNVIPPMLKMPNSRWLQTLFSFGAMHAIRLVLPLLAFPWLGRALGENAFGLLMYMCLFPPIIGLCTDWGFPLGAARLAAENRGHKNRLGFLLRGVVLAKLMLALACALLCALLAPFLPHVPEYPLPFLFAFCAGLTRGFSPLWFYQGTNFALARLAIWDISSSLAALALTIGLVRKPDEWPFYLALYACCKGSAWLHLTFSLLRSFPGQWSIRHSIKLLRECRALFAGLMLADLYHYLAQLVCSFFLTPSSLGVFLALSKMLRALTSLVLPFTQTLFPEICLLGKSDPEKSRHILRISLFGTGIAMCCACALAWPLSPFLLHLALGKSFVHNAEILHILLLAAPLAAINTVLAFQALVPSGHDQALALARLLMAIASLPLAFILVRLWGLQGAALIPACAETLLLLLLARQIWLLCPKTLFKPRN